MQAFLDRDRRYKPVTAADVLRFATIDGARAIGLGDRVGSISKGKRADLVLLRTDRLAMSPLNDPAGAIVAAASVADVDTVIVDGVIKKRGGVLTAVDTRAIADHAALSGGYLAKQMRTTGAGV